MASLGFDKFNNLYISGSYRIRKVNVTSGIITTIAGNGLQGFSGDGSLATNAGFGISRSNIGYGEASGEIAIDTFGNIYYSDLGRIRKIDYLTNIISTIAGNGQLIDSGDGGNATNAKVNCRYLVIDKKQNILYVSCNLRIRKINLNTNIISTVIGDGQLPFSSGGTSTNPNSIGYPNSISIDSASNLFSYTSGNSYILKYNTKTNTLTYPACQSSDVVCDMKGNLYLANYDMSSCTLQNKFPQIFKWANNQLGSNSVIAGTSSKGFSGDGSLAINAQLNIKFYSASIICDNINNLYFFDYNNNRIRKISFQTLPLKILSFTTNFQQNKVQLNWQTTNEQNVSHINIQRSTNNKEFNNIGKVKANCCEYSFQDSPPLEGLGVVFYYRLEIVDNDGTKTYSEVKNIEQGTRNNEIRIYPNPAKNLVTIETKNAKEVLIIDLVGRTIKTFNKPSSSIQYKIEQAGLYFVKVVLNNGETKLEKLIVN